MLSFRRRAMGLQAREELRSVKVGLGNILFDVFDEAEVRKHAVEIVGF